MSTYDPNGTAGGFGMPSQPYGGQPQSPYAQPTGPQGPVAPTYTGIGSPSGYTGYETQGQQPYAAPAQQPYAAPGPSSPTGPGPAYPGTGQMPWTGAGQTGFGGSGFSGPSQPVSGPQTPVGYTTNGVTLPQPAGQDPQQGETPRPGFGYVSTGKGGRDRLKLWQIGVLAVAIFAFAAFLIVSVIRPATCQPPPTTAVIRSASMGDSFTGDALFVRDEAAYDAEGVTSVDYIAAEGQTVFYNNDICKIFAAGYSTKEVNTLQEYRDQIRDYEMGVLTSETTIEGRRYTLDSNVLQAVLQVRRIMSGDSGNLTNQEQALNRAINERQTYIRELYANDQRLTRFYDDVIAQEQKIDSYTKRQKAIEEAVVSFYSDGFEYGLNMNTYRDFEPAQVRRMLNGEKPVQETLLKGRTTVYRMVKDNGWAVLMLADDKTWHPADGQTYDMVITSANQMDTIRVTVESSRLSGNELLVCLRATSPVTDVLYLRTGRVEVRDDSLALMVPQRAIYVQPVEQNGVMKETQGVVADFGGEERFVPITIIRQDGDNVYIAPLQNVLREGMTVRLF